MAQRVVFDHMHQLNYLYSEETASNSIVIVKAEAIDEAPHHLKQAQWTKDYFTQLVRENHLSLSYKNGRK